MALPAPDAPEPRVALIEDDDDSREVTAYFLSQEGFAIDEFAQAEDALVSFARVLPAIVITDVTLPGMGGYELARLLRADTRTAGLPIIALTGRSDIGPEHRALFDKVLTKPFGPDDLASLAHKLVAAARRSVAPVVSAPATVQASAPAEPAPAAGARVASPSASVDYGALVEHSPTMMWRAAPDGKRDWFNATWLAFRGRSLADEVGDGWAHEIHNDDVASCLSDYRSAIERRAPFAITYRLRRYDGEYREVVDRGAPFPDTASAQAGFIGTCSDVHDEREVERARAKFLGTVAHDLRTPLTPIRAYAHQLKRFLARGTMPPVEAVDKLAAQTERVVRLVEALALAARLELGVPTTLTLDDVDLAGLLRELVDELRHPQAPTLAPRLVIDLRGVEAPLVVRADAPRLRLAIGNVLENALMYSHSERPITVTLAATANGARIAVDDEGIGVPHAELPHLGSRYFRASNTLQQGLPGLGLGLATATEIAAAHGGALTIEARDPGLRVVIAIPTTARGEP